MFQRILTKLPFYQSYLQKRLQRQSAFYQNNRIEVIITYRHLLKQIPNIYPRTLQQAQKLNEIRWIYKKSMQLPNIYETMGRTKFAQKIVNQIQNGDYTSLGDYVPHRFGAQRRSMQFFLNQIYLFLFNTSGTNKRWWRGYIF